MMSGITRPPVRWHGAKFLMSRQILPHLPSHRLYTEVYGGGAGVLLHKPRSHAEVYNDLDEDIVNLFRVLQDTSAAARLIELLRLTPFARAEFELAYEWSPEPVERARRLVIRSFMGFGSNAHSSTQRGHQSTGFRSNSNRSGTTPAHDWANLPEAYPAIVARFRGVVIEHRDAVEVLQRHDGERALHYVDPPYVHDTRSMFKGGKSAYKHEMDLAAHKCLLGVLRGLKGMVVLSGYAHPLYDAALDDWRRIEFEAYADGARPRIEVLWINPSAAAALDREHAGIGVTPLFCGGAA
ncbi:site-specific DNA methylase [Bradyrhizobium sp. YR681]|uniref:DNA adenine methylase n=1 Tax=Bradyrhizobium sp. YR681 TaxID=1144344 RepID=UPI0002710D34|nr:DNA adenine methylase [Bradyrhizobium sp. YR681]EJN11832.1 site-specific DNA methylase [Bradyrhizobium sp. YR681]